MNTPADQGRVARITCVWVGFVVRHALAVVLATLVTVVPLAYYALTHLGVDTSTADMIAERLEWRQAFIEYREAFPQLDHNLVVVIDAGDADRADLARDRLAAELAEREALFEEVFAPGADHYFRRHALLYLERDELGELADELARMQPFIARLAADPTVAGLFGVIEEALASGDPERIEALAPLLERIAEVADSVRAGQPDALSWQAVMRGQPETPQRRVIVLKPRLDFAELAPAQEAIAAVREIATARLADLGEPVTVRLTGPVALEYEELVSVTRGAKRAGLLAGAFVLVILALGLRSAWLVIASLLTLVTGLIATAAFAAFAVGDLNLISIAFAVLYIGLGIDFAIHYCLRVRESLARGAPIEQALAESAGDVGASLVLCAVTTSIGFFAFFPTTFRGVSELGLISGTGMYISLLVTLTLLPALLRLIVPRVNRPLPKLAVLGPLVRHRAVWPLTAVIVLGSLATLPFVSFDSDPLNLRSAEAESVATFNDLLADPDYAPRALSVIAADPGAVEALAQRLEQLPVTHAVRRLEDFVPSGQDEKLMLIDELAWLVGPQLAQTTTQSRAPQRQGLARTATAVDALRVALAERAQEPAAARLAAALGAIRQDQGQLGEFSTLLMDSFPARLDALAASLEAGAVEAADLPATLQARWIAADGRRRLEVSPVSGYATDAGREAFVDGVRAVAPGATGLAVVQTEAGRAVVAAFRQAFVTALVLVGAMLLVLLRDWRKTAIVLAPMVAAGLVTTAVMVMLGIRFNFANVIALPLLLGVGVDNGIHMVARANHRAQELLESSTARAVLFSAMTTIASFGNLAFSGHPGSASMGQVLTIGMVATTLATLVLVPALIARTTP